MTLESVQLRATAWFQVSRAMLDALQREQQTGRRLFTRVCFRDV